MLKVFADDSGSGGDSKWFVLGGYLASAEAWIAFEPQWSAALADGRPIEYFKASEAESRKGQFEGFSVDERNAKIDTLIAVIVKHARQAVYVRVRQEHYDEIIKGSVPPAWDSPYYYLFMTLMTCCTAVERQYGSGSPIRFIFDTHQTLASRSENMYSKLRNIPQFAGSVSGVQFEDEKQFLPLQSADLLAWQVRRSLCVPDEPRRKHLDASRACAYSPMSYILQPKDLQDAANSLELNAKRLAESLGVPVSSIQPWKNKTRKKR
jgi:hypothetical protein